MRPSPELELVLVPTDPDTLPIEAAQALIDRWIANGSLTPNGEPGPHAGALLPEGFARIRLDRPDGVSLYANRQGGFRVACPSSGANLVPAFVPAVAAWRGGGPRALSCPACGSFHPLEALQFAPPAAFGRMAIVIAAAGAAALTPEATAEVERALGPVHRIGRRG